MQVGPKSSILSRTVDYLSRSPQVFLLGLLVACVVEVAVDWNTTLYEINVARRALRQKGENYADVLRKAAQAPTAARDGGALGQLASKLFDDQDVVYLRFIGSDGATIGDTLRPDYEADRRSRGLLPFRDHYRYVMERDLRGMLSDPEGLRERMMKSRHRDLYQVFTDLQERLLRRFLPGEPGARPGPLRVLYQDRLSDPSRRGLDRSLTYALGTITGTGRGCGPGDVCGVVLVAFRTDRLSREIMMKLFKGLGVATFFVGLILVQNIIGRRDKLRLRRLTEAFAGARAAISTARPRPAPPPGTDLGIAFEQADSVEGTVYELRQQPGGALELLLAVPQGGGLDAAFASVVLGELYRRAGGEAQARPPAERLAALLGAYAASPQARPVWLLLLQLLPGGGVRGASCGLPPPALLDGGAARPLALGPPLSLEGAAAALCPSPRSFSGGDAGGVALYCDGRPAGADGPLPQAEALGLLAAGLHRGRGAQDLADDAAALARRRHRGRLPEDLFVLVIGRHEGRGA